LIKDLFHEMDAEIICHLPLNKYGPPDRLIRRPTATGQFTVRSAYYVEKERQEQQKGEGSQHSRPLPLCGQKDHCTREDLNLFGLVAKKIWARRNVVMHGGEFTHPNRIVHEADELLKSIQALPGDQTGEGERGGCATPLRWERPPFGRFKINCDVAIDTQAHCMAFGAIIRDHRGLVCAAKCIRFDRAYEPVIGEAMAAVELCKEIDLHDVILEGDSLQVVQALKERSPSWRVYGHFIDVTKNLLGSCRSWMVQHVRREANQAAHGLATEGLRLTNEQRWINETPECINAIVSSELHALDV
jgi:hypothetical protein